MKLSTQELEQTPAVVKVNGKRVLQPIAVDTDEGWVDALVPKIIDEVKIEAGGTATDKEGGGVFEYVTRRLTGKVEVFVRK